MKYYYTYRNKVKGYESKHYRTIGAVKAALTTMEKYDSYYNKVFNKSDYEIVTYECNQVAVTQLQ